MTEATRAIRMEGRGEIDPDVLGWEQFQKQPVVVDATPMPAPFEVDTKEGTMQGGEGDILIRGVEGEYYPCNSDIFAQTYRPVGEDTVESGGYTEDDLFDAFVAGFMRSGEGGNAEYPHNHDEERIREALGESFTRFLDGKRGGSE